MSKYIAEDRISLLDLYDETPDCKELFEILARLSDGAAFVQYAHEKDVFIAQYDDRSYVIAYNVLGDTDGTMHFEAGVLTETGWEKLNCLLGGVSSCQMN